MLGATWTWGLAALSIAGYGALFLVESSHGVMSGHHAPAAASLHLQGMWLAFSMAAALTAYFVSRLVAEIERREVEVLAMREPGMGLGLFLTKTIASQLGGRLLLDSRVGVGVRQAHDSASAISAAREEPPEYALVDLRLPGDSGLTVVRELRELDAATRIVVLTGYGSIATALEAIRLGATHYLTKPATVDDVIAGFEQGAAAKGSLSEATEDFLCAGRLRVRGFTVPVEESPAEPPGVQSDRALEHAGDLEEPIPR